MRISLTRVGTLNARRFGHDLPSRVAFVQTGFVLVDDHIELFKLLREDLVPGIWVIASHEQIAALDTACGIASGKANDVATCVLAKVPISPNEAQRLVG